jgi:GNAT superfamily N-acetyltransferase
LDSATVDLGSACGIKESWQVIIRYARKGDGYGIERVHVESWRSTYAGIVPDEYLAALKIEPRAAEWDRSLAEAAQQVIFVAEDLGEVVGFAMCGAERSASTSYEGELYGLYLLREYQRRGTGTQLVHAVARELYGRKFRSMLVWALAANPNRAFYERLGGKLVMQKEIEIGGKLLFEVGYGWKDITRLLSPTRQEAGA